MDRLQANEPAVVAVGTGGAGAVVNTVARNGGFRDEVPAATFRVSRGTLSIEHTDLAPPDWDEYVTRNPDASIYHLARFPNVARTTFGLPVHYLTVRNREGEVQGVLPLVEQVIVPWTRCLVSLPFVTYGGPLADDEHSLLMLARAGEHLAQRRRARRMLIRDWRQLPALGYAEKCDKVSMLLDLPSDPDDLFKRLGSKLRSQVRRADREGPEVVFGHVELVPEFYPVFCSKMHDLGTPVYPRRFFRNFVDAAGDAGTVVIVRLEGRPVAGAILVRWRDRVEVPWAVSLGEVQSKAINMRLYWELIRFAIGQGCSIFDFGRCTVDGGTYHFKKQWGARPLQLHWRNWTLEGRRGRVPALDDRGGFDRAVNLWKQMPLKAANWLGPRISARLPW